MTLPPASLALADSVRYVPISGLAPLAGDVRLTVGGGLPLIQNSTRTTVPPLSLAWPPAPLLGFVQVNPNLAAV